MRLRSIPFKTCITLAREQKLMRPRFMSVARGWNRRDVETLGCRGRMRRQVSRKPFEEKLLYLQDELGELTRFTADGFDASKLEREIKGQIERLLQFLGYVYI